jgi:putative addiction module component (TIGR02574 family)
MDAAVLEKEALKLSVPERALLADRLLQTLGAANARVTQAWADEGERRLASYRAGELGAEDGTAVVGSLRKQFG